MVKAKSCSKGFKSKPPSGEKGSNLSNGFQVKITKPEKRENMTNRKNIPKLDWDFK